MYRHRAYQQIIYGHFNEFIKANDELNAIARKKGWPEATLWTPVVGTGNDAVLETDYADLASFEKVNRAFQSDAESMKVYRGTAGLVVQGSVRDELFEQVSRPLA
ncbi:MAG: hypothetical protein E6J13_15020 [Chloroflexi bacterium]|nr:MAG: hypothetical protein E6J13_15020 [Chloroflexota bacterium]